MNPAPFPALHFPDGTPFEIRPKGEGYVILDRIRRKFVQLTPEEWVRQHLIRALVERLGYPIGLIKQEAAITTTGGPRRADVVSYGRDQRPYLIAECKAPTIALRQDVFEQVSRYNTVTGSPVLLVTNGLEHYCWRVDRDTHSFNFLKEIPQYPD